MPRHSQIQRKVLQLYKEFLRISDGKPDMKYTIQCQFKKNAEYPRTDTQRIEHMIRRAERQLKQLKKSTVTNVTAFEKVC